MKRITLITLIFSFLLSIALPKYNLQAAPDDGSPKVLNYLFIGVLVYAAYKLIDHEFFSDGNDEAANSFTEADSAYLAYQYIVTPPLYHDIKNAKNSQKRAQLIDRFWQSEGTIEQRTEFERRIYHSNLHFSLPYKNGWETDMGRIYIMFGEPEDIIKNDVNFNNDDVSDYTDKFEEKPVNYAKSNNGFGNDYEVWYYSIPKFKNDIPNEFKHLDDGRTIFIFELANIKGKNILVYSTSKTETR